MDELRFIDVCERLLESAREIARRNRKRIDDLRQQFALPEDTDDWEGEENAPSNE